MSINNILVAGAGQMGHGIAQIALISGFKSVTLHDLNKKVLQVAKERIYKGLLIYFSKGFISSKKACQELMHKLNLSDNLNKAIIDVDFVFEAISENLELKTQFLKKIGMLAPQNAIFASNTSTIPISLLAKASQRPKKVVGMHFFYPVPRQCCVEVMKTDYTSERTFNIAKSIGEILPCVKGKRMVAICHKDSPGFIANRLLITSQIYINWVIDKAYELGISCEQLDLDAGAGSFLPMGPCELSDYLGLNILYHSMRNFEKHVSKQFKPGKIITNLVQQGNYGKKTGKGFYDWNSEGKPIKSGLKKADMFDPEIILAIQLNEGCKLIEEEIVKGYKIIDNVMLKGTSMPGPFAPGIRKYTLWSNLLEELEIKTEKKIFEPCELMKTGNFKNYRT